MGKPLDKQVGKILEIKNEKYICFADRTEDGQWQFRVAIPFSSLSNKVTRTLIIVLFSVVAMLLLGFWGSLLLEKLTTRSLDELLGEISKIGSGNYSVKATHNNRLPLEIQSIRDALAKMASKIQMQTSELITQKEEIGGQYQEINALYEETTAMNEELNDLYDRLQGGYKLTVQALANAIEANDGYTRGHCERVTAVALRIAEVMNLSATEKVVLEYAGMLHDVGKVGISGDILNKESALTSAEYEIIKTHPQIGWKIISDVPFLAEAATIIRQHHERVDGLGYPDKLTGAEMVIGAKILGIADAFDAMVSERSYRPIPLSVLEAATEIDKYTGKQFDASVAKAFFTLLQREGQLPLDFPRSDSPGSIR